MKRFIEISQFVLILSGLLLCGLFLTTMIGQLPIHGNALQWTIFAGQNILAFILPSVLVWKICFKASPLKELEATTFPSLLMLGLAMLIYFIGMPMLNQIVYWNQEMQLPEILSSFENWSREMEQLAEQQTKGLLSSTDFLPTAINILVIGVLTGIGEEFFFRGALQRGLARCGINVHKAIWISAFVFSAMHFQFYGFVPRLLLGAFFGYLYLWSGNIWVNAFAHALNNSLVIVSTWCINKGYLSEDFDMLGVSESGVPAAAILSALAVGTIIIYLVRSGIIHESNNIPPANPSKNQ